MASLYARKGRWWLSWFVHGERFSRSTGLLLEERAKALEAKAQLERELKARKAAQLPGKTYRTFAGYRKHWIESRTAMGVGSARDDEVRLRHARDLDVLSMEEIRPRHIRDVVLRLRAEKRLAPRTIRHVVGVLHRMFEDAVVDEVVPANPCKLAKGDLPPKMDKSPTWRADAIFSREEVELLLSCDEVPAERRVLYAILFLSGCRIGEVAALRWRSYEPEARPLGRLRVELAYNRKKKLTKGVKTDRPRHVPVHPLLAKSLAEWKLWGWGERMGRKPQAEDLLFPAPTGNNLRDPVVHANLLRDLKALEMRPRRTHDARRTFVSLALADGARKDILRWVSHGPTGDIIDLYTTIPWEALCAEVSKLNIRPRGAAALSLHPDAAQKKEQA